MSMMETLKNKLQTDSVLCIAWILALGTMILVPPDAIYIDYVDAHTLGLLFSLMAVMAGVQRMGLFRRMGEWMLHKTKNTRQLELVLVFLPFFSGMLVTNDVALITFVPFAIEILFLANLEQRIPSVVVMQTIAANLGSMSTPIGNPQNLYLYSHYEMTVRTFFQTMLPFTIIAGVLIAILVWLHPSKTLSISIPQSPNIEQSQKNMLLVYTILFILCLCVVGRWLPVWSVTCAVLLTIGWLDRNTLLHVDYSLLFTFLGFFIFVGNLGRLDWFCTLFQTILVGRELLCGILVSQIISNVPAALLLSSFTEHGTPLLIGVNLGGLGTLIASMASLISYKYIVRTFPDQKMHYLIRFTTTNLVMLLVLYLTSLLLQVRGATF